MAFPTSPRGYYAVTFKSAVVNKSVWQLQQKKNTRQINRLVFSSESRFFGHFFLDSVNAYVLRYLLRNMLNS